MIDLSDETVLLAEIKADNKDAFSFCSKKYSRRLQGYASRFVQDEETVKDIVQECFSEVLGKRFDILRICYLAAVCHGAQQLPLDYLKHQAIVEQYQVEYLANQDGEGTALFCRFRLDAE